MIEILLVFATLGWITSGIALSVALYAKHKSEMTLKAEISEMRAEISMIQPRVEKYLEKKILESMVETRTLAQSDALELMKSSEDDNFAPRGYGALDIASFNNI